MVMVNPDRSTAQTAHDVRHLDGRLRCLPAAIMFFVEAALASLMVVFQQENFVNDRDFVLNLNLGQRIADGFADVLGMGGGSP
jgi:hypothetical protein